jgi:hypothetical protein
VGALYLRLRHSLYDYRRFAYALDRNGSLYLLAKGQGDHGPEATLKAEISSGPLNSHVHLPRIHQEAVTYCFEYCFLSRPQVEECGSDLLTAQTVQL